MRRGGSGEWGGACRWSLGAHQECFWVCCERKRMGSQAVTVLETQALGGVWA